MENIPIVTFDTSAHNRLAPKGGPLAEPVIAKIKSDMLFRFAGVAIEEIYATKDSTRRSLLLNSCRKLQEGESDCVHRQDEVLKILVEAHVKDPARFDWTAAEVISGEYMQEISRGKWINDEDLIAKHRREHFAQLKRFEQMFKPFRAELRPVFEANREARPKTYREFLDLMEKSNQKLMAGLCIGIYDRVAGTDVSKELFLAFLDDCPPFRAFNYAMHMAHFDRSVRHENGERFSSECTDLFMATYLPYCHKFVTADRMQEKCLREIASVSGLGTEVMSYDDFCNSSS
jgi:hypothetical protein